jgi:hypothetical protein
MNRIFASRAICILFFASFVFFVPADTNAQQKLSDFTMYAAGSAPGQGITLMGSSITVNGGIVGANKLVQTTGNTTINAGIYSGDRIILTNSNIVTGKISALNSSGSANAISIGSSATLGDNITDSILAKGGIDIGGGSVAGIVRLPAGQTYSGPAPGGGPVVYSDPYIPAQPTLFTEANISGGNGTVTTNQTYVPGTYGAINYSGNRTLTLRPLPNSTGDYVYYFKSFKWSGNSNKLIFDFNGGTGKFFIYVEGNADFGKLNAIVTGGGAGKIYVETHGDGAGTSVAGNSFIIANGSSGGGSKWFGTVYASRAGISIGSGTGSSTLTGALYSATNVSVQSGVVIEYAPFDPCASAIVNAGTNRPLNFFDADSLRGSTTTTNPYLTWTILPGSGGSLDPLNIHNDTVAIYSAGIYILTDSSAPTCFVRDTVEIFSKVRDVIGAELLSIYINKPNISPFFVIANGKVKIDVVAFEGKRDEVRDTLVNYGFTNFYPNGTNPYMLTGDFPIANILLLNNYGSIINYCRTYYQPFTFRSNFFNTSDSAKTGLVITQGDTTMRTHLIRPGYKLNGAGIKIGILSDSYGKITGNSVSVPPYNPSPGPIPQTFTTQDVRGDIISGDLPSDTILQRPGLPDTVIKNSKGFAQNVKVLQDFPVQLTDEGRAMAEIVHDVAPGAGIVFRTAFFTANDFAQGIIDLKNAGCKIIVDDVTYPTEPFLKDGVVAKTVDSLAINHGITYLSAAGNFADQSYEKNYNPVDASDIGFPDKTAHNFGSGDRFQKIKLRPGNYTFVFQWLDNIYSIGQGGTLFDVDFYLSKKTNGTELIGFNRNNLNGDPIEFIPITILGDSPTDTVAKEYNLLVINNTTSGNPASIKYIAFKRDGRADIQWQEYHEGVSTIIGQSNAANALAIGAARFNHTIDRYSLEPHPLMPDPLNGIPASSITKPQLESFSSVGGTNVNGVPRQKPDLVAPDGVNTLVRMGQDYPNNALDGFSNFFGTSAAAPHAAAAAALLMQGRKKFLAGHPETSPAEIKTLFQSTAFDMLSPGFDYSSGAGLIDADSAMRTFASPTPFEIDLIVPDNTVPGQSTFTLIITGQNFSANSHVVLGDTTGMANGTADTTQIWPTSITRDEITVVINSFTGNPPVMVYSPPKTEFGDGGFSNILYFFSGKIVVQAISFTKSYGDPMPVLDTIIKINDTLIQNTNYTLADIGLSGLTVTTSATAGSPVGPYNILVNGNLDPSDPVDSAFLTKYTYQFINGTVLVAPLSVTVVPDDDTVVYGQPINNITYKYYDSSGNLITNPALLNELDSSQHVYMADNALVVMNGYPGLPALTDADFQNMNGLITFNAIRNSRKFQFTNGSLVPVVPADSSKLSGQYYIDVSAQSFIDYKTNAATGILSAAYPGITSKAIVSAASLLNGTAQTGLNTTNLVKLVNGELMKVVNAVAGGTLMPVVNGELMQVVNGLIVVNDTVLQTINGELVKVVNGELVKVVNGELVKVVNGELVHVVNGELVKVVNGELVKVVNGELVKLVNAAGGTLVQMVNGILMQVVNGVGLVPVVNGELVKVVNGELVKVVNNEAIANYSLVKLVNGGLVQVVNGVGLVQMVNGIEIPLANGLVQVVNGELMQVVNGELVKVVNGGILIPVVNGLVPLVNSYTVSNGNNEKAVVILDLNDTARNTTLGAIFSTNIITGLDVGVQTLISGMVKNNNFKFTYAPGHVTIKKDTITVAANNVTKIYGEPNPELTVTYNGFELGQNKQTSGITGSPDISTAAVLTSPVGTYPITVTAGTLASSNYAFKFVNGTLTVNSNPCLLTHSPFKNFGNTTQSPTSLWFNLVTKVSGQLTAQGDSLLFRGGSITLNAILSNPLIKDSVLPDGIIIADNSVSTPVTSFDIVKGRWVTKVPVGYASTSDIFVTGAIINSSNGFIKQNGNTSSTVKGMFFSNRSFTDQWAYAMAAYQLPQTPVPPVYATYSMIAAPGDIVSINGTYRAATPIPLIPYIVQGASGGGTNYSGSKSSFDNFTACLVTAPGSITQRQANSSEEKQPQREIFAAGVNVYPNPASDHITLMIVPAQQGNSRTELLSLNGTKLFESSNGYLEAGVKYRKEINTNQLPNGIYLIRIWNGNTVTNKKIIISR